jgi:transglutaminase-like putative cysteine protease
LQLKGGRQRVEGNLLTIDKELLSDLPPDLNVDGLDELEKVFLQPSPFIQSDHEDIQALVQKIIGPQPSATPLEKTRKLMAWVYQNIEKRPVLSLPDALSTLDNRMGDCNEHAVLMAALARAAGIPCRIEAGLVYLKGRFYYHAWNLVYVGRWITLDSLFGQMPADVSHIRFTSGTQQQQIDIVGVIGKVRLRIIP